jgi:hypothetical protein
VFILRVLIPALVALPFLWATPILIDKTELLSPYRKLAFIFMAGMFLVSLVGAVDFLRHNSKEQWRQAAEFFEKNYQSGDVLIYVYADKEIAFIRYLPPKFYSLPALAVPSGSFLKLGPHRPQPLNKDVEDRTGLSGLQMLKAKKSRLWLIVSQSPAAKRFKTVVDPALAWVDTNYRSARELKYKTLHFVLYEPL